MTSAAKRVGLSSRGIVRLSPAELSSELGEIRTIALFGGIGARDWPAFAASPEYSDGAPDPLDRWSRRLIGALAEAFGAIALYPFDGPPYHPFQRWAQRAEPVFPSPLGLLIHAEYGLWHNYRGALAFAEAIEAPPRQSGANPCEACAERPCLSACPVEAFSDDGYDLKACAGHLRAPEGDDCMQRGCLARRACPIGRDYMHGGGQAEFHMRAFLRSRANI